MNSIFTRRSIRKFTSEEVTDEDLKYILKAGMAAPSARNEQPWHFIVIKNRKILEQIPEFHQYSQMLKQAPLAILVCGDKDIVPGDRPVEEKIGYIVQDCSATTENILLAIDSRGLGGVWLGIYPVSERMEGMEQLLDIPDNIIPVSLIAVGHPAETKEGNDRYLEDRIHLNKY